MRHIVLILFLIILVSCNAERKSYSSLTDNNMTFTRKYIGNFIDYAHTGPDVFGGVNLIWIRTSVFNTFGKLSVFGKECKFSYGDRLFLRRIYSTPQPNGEWDYQVENDSSVCYRLSNYRYENNALVQALF